MPLQITVEPLELGYNSKTKEFIYSHSKAVTLTLEHSLVSISKWESKWKTPFLSKTEMTTEETIDYIRCMTITQNVDPNVYRGIDDKIIRQVNDYIKDPMTATWFKKEENSKGQSVIITSERIYYWMTALQIPPEYQKWHLNRLITLIRVCEIENRPKKKMPRSETLAQYKALAAKRRNAHKSKG